LNNLSKEKIFGCKDKNLLGFYSFLKWVIKAKRPELIIVIFYYFLF